MVWILTVLGLAVLLAALVLAVAPLRRTLLSGPALNAFRRVLPAMSDTERDALEAGTVWWEGDLFSGKPDWRRLAAYPAPRLTPREQAFVDEAVPRLCALVNDWDVTERLHDIPEEAWQMIKREGFLGMIIPTEYGGLGFSAYAHSEVITCLSTRCSALAVSVMVPNSLGPAELLLQYGTDDQKKHYLPRLATGEEIPAFALTSPWAGSDAAAIPDSGVVCRGMWQGSEVLGMRVSWDKRYITLAPICTLLGLAFRLFDPDGLIGTQRDIGITCALVPHDHPGVDTGRRHRPLGAMFMNGPTRGRDVFMPLEFIIGGPSMAGQGWRMLMECLAAGRSISLPASNTGMAKLTARAVGAYSTVRQQFRMAVGKFEGVEEALARIAGHTYLMDAARTVTAGALDLGEKPSVVSAIVKYHVTERARIVVNDGMDVIGGKGICLGPSNFLGHAYQQIPIGITVEGANILTRSLILFGQGAIRCHPCVLDEMRAVAEPDRQKSLRQFDRAFWRHVRFTLGNLARAARFGLAGGPRGVTAENVAPDTQIYYRQISRLSCAFALCADVSMLVLGGELKRREKLSGRLGDILSQLYLASAALKHFENGGRQADDAPLLHWAVQDALYRAQSAFDGLLANFPRRAMAHALRVLMFPWGSPQTPPSDSLGRDAARILLAPGAARDRLTRGCHVPASEDEPVGAIELALAATLAAAPAQARVRSAEKEGMFEGHPGYNVRDISQAAFDLGVIGAEDYALLQRSDRLRDLVIGVDDFPFDLRAQSAATAPRPWEKTA